MDVRRELIYELLNGTGRIELPGLRTRDKPALNELWRLGIVKRNILPSASDDPRDSPLIYEYCPVCLARWRARRREHGPDYKGDYT